MAYYQLEPWGDERADLRMGIQAAVLANVHRARNQRPLKPADFMPRFEHVAEPGDGRMTPEQMFEAAVRITRAFGGKVQVGR